MGEIVRRPPGRMAFRRAPSDRGSGARQPAELGGYRRVDPRRFASQSDEQLVAQVRAGDDSAFEAIYDRYARGVLVFCGHMLGSRDEAEDALQLTFVSAYQALRGGDNGVSLRPWLYTIARNRCLSELRARPYAVQMDEPVVDRVCLEGPGVQVQRRAELRDVVDEIKRLPAEQRAALVLFELGDHSHAEIAEVLGVSREKVKALIFQAREALVRGREARDGSCAAVRERLATVRGKIPVRSTTRAHIDRCPSCKAFEHEVRRQRAALALILPVGLVGEVKASVLSVVFTGGGGSVAAGAGASGGGGIVAAGAGASGSGVVLSSGAAAAGSGTAAVGGGAVGTVAVGAGAASGLTGAGGLASVGAGAGGLVVASAAPVTAVATGLTAGGTELAVAGGVAGAGSTAVVAKIVAAAAIASAVFGASHAAGPVQAPTTIVSGNPAIHQSPPASAASNLGAAKLPATPSSASTSGMTTGDAGPNTQNPNTPGSSTATSSSTAVGPDPSTGGSATATTGGSSTAAGTDPSTGGSATATMGGSSTTAGTSPATSGSITAAGTNPSTGGATSATTGGSSTTAGTSPATSGSTTAAGTSPTTSTTTGSAQGVPEAQAGQAQSDAAAPVEDAATQVGDEIAFIQASSVPTGPKQTLIDKLSAADAALGAGDKKLAENDLDAALNYIDARSGKTIPKTTATRLIADFTRIKAAIG